MLPLIPKEAGTVYHSMQGGSIARAAQRGDRGRLNVREPPDHDGAAALDHADHRRLVLLQGAAPPPLSRRRRPKRPWP